jgi:hypothetical protein
VRTVAEPFASVVVPTHQRRALVQRAVRSALNQQFPSFEVIVVDDGSTDGTRDALARLVDQGLIRYEWQPNRGPSAARNVGIGLARGEVVAFLDSDDWWLPDHLSVICDLFARHPEAVLATTCPNWLIGGRERSDESRVVDPLPSLFLTTVAGHPSCTAVRRQALRAVDGFRTDVIVRGDVDLWMRLALRGPCCVVQRRTITYNRSDGTFVDQGRREGRCLDALELSTARMLSELERLASPDTTRLRARGQGKLEFIRALRALDRHDSAAAVSALGRACRLLPELSSHPGLVAHHLTHQLPRAHEPGERAWHMATAASAWPEPDSATADYLRIRAIAPALRAGRLTLALRLLGGLRPRTLWRASKTTANLGRERVRHRRGRPRSPGRRA